ncbi:MAG: amino acid carrier protein [Oscillospiraceae bacterium]
MNVTFLSALEAFVTVLWGWPLILGLVGIGIYLTIRGKLWQLRHFKDCFAGVFKQNDGAKGGEHYEKTGKLTAYRALAVACGAAIGVGNIGGVSSAIALGGPGVLFWMWVCAFVGMMTKMCEVTLGVHYRSVDQNGKTFGGAPFYIEKGFKELGIKGGKILATCFAFSFFLDMFFGMENYTISEAVSSTFNLPMIPVAIVYFLVCKFVILGGMKSISSLSAYLFPFMAIFYILGGLYILGSNFSNLGNTFALIFKSAFTPTAAIGGFAGSALILTIRTGVARSVYSNEAGRGSSPFAHATADVRHPIEQGKMGILEVFFDTFVICSITGLVIVNTGVWNSGLSGATLALNAFNIGFGGTWGGKFMTIALILFCLTTAFGWFVYFESVLRYLFRGNSKMKERMVWILKIFLHGTPSMLLTIAAVVLKWDTSSVWMFADLASGIPVYINMFCLLLLSGKFFQLLRHYNKTRYHVKDDGIPDDMPIFSQIKMPYEEAAELERASKKA